MSLGLTLVQSSTGPLGDFKMPVCTNIVASKGLFLSDEDIDVILSRYKEHVEFWNISQEIVSRELFSFINVANREPQSILSRFEVLDRWFWRQYLEPVYRMQPHQTLERYATIGDRSYAFYIETQRTRTVITVTPFPKQLMNQADLVNLKNLAGCLAKQFQVRLDIPGVLKEHVRIFVRTAARSETGQVAFSAVGAFEACQWIENCATRLAGSYSATV
jgi:hypothetical protein